MAKLRRAIWLTFLSAIIVGVGCGSPTEPEPLLWVEEGGLFYIRDLARAQEEIPFLIVVPSHLPSEGEDVKIPAIRGPL